jgi:predicted nucleotide-binding protein
MEKYLIIAKLRALYTILKKHLRDPRSRYFDPSTVLELFKIYDPLRDVLISQYPKLFGDLPVREVPSPIKTTDFDGRGYIVRQTLESLLQDMGYSIDVLAATPEGLPKETVPKDARNVFVVHGRNKFARDSLFEFLRALKLNPIEWDEAVKMTGKASPFIGEILDKAFSEAQAVVVLLSGDDEARLKKEFQSDEDPPFEKNLTSQARPNVLFEAGMAFGRHEDRTVIVQIGTELRPFSDIAGRHIIKLNNSSEQRNALAQRLQTAGCPVNTSGSNWLSAGDFEAASISSKNSALSESDHTDEINQFEIKYDAYWKKSNGDGPFCMRCKDEYKLLIYMINNNDILYRCTKCNNVVRGPDAAKLAAKVNKSSKQRANSYASGIDLNRK